MRLIPVLVLCGSLSAAFAQTEAAPATPFVSSLARIDRMAHTLDAALSGSVLIERAHIGVSVVRVSDGAVLYAHNDQQLFVPASNTKLLTTTAAFALLGPDFKTRTTVESVHAASADGSLHGDLFLVGRGDPNLSGRVLPYDVKTERVTPPLRSLEILADQVVASGVKRITGDIVGDDTWFAYERWGDSWGEDDLMWEYAAPVSALTINDNVMFLDIAPGAKAGDPAVVSADPFVDLYTIENRMITGAPRSARRVGIDRQPGSYKIVIWGSIPAASAPQSEALAMEDPALFAAAAFRNMLIARGVRVGGAARALHTDETTLPFFPEAADAPALNPAAPPQPTAPARLVLAQLESQPLSVDLKVINKVSQNLHVEILLRQLGRERSNLAGSAAGGSIYGGTSVVHQFLTSIGITPDEYQYNDGSGMTPHNLVTPAMLTKLLRYARTQPWSETFLDTLPLAGSDGSLEHRFLKTPTADRVRAKTGSLTEVAALSGYATTLDGDDVAFSIQVNDSKLGGSGSRQLIDTLVRAIVETR